MRDTLETLRARIEAALEADREDFEAYRLAMARPQPPSYGRVHERWMPGGHNDQWLRDMRAWWRRQAYAMRHTQAWGERVVERLAEDEDA